MEQAAHASSIETIFNKLIAAADGVPLGNPPGVCDAGGVNDNITTELAATRDALVTAINLVDPESIPTSWTSRSAIPSAAI